MPTKPMSPYAVQKLTGELLCGVFTQILGYKPTIGFREGLAHTLDAMRNWLLDNKLKTIISKI